VAGDHLGGTAVIESLLNAAFDSLIFSSDVAIRIGVGEVGLGRRNKETIISI